MQRVYPVCVLCAAIISIALTLTLVAPSTAGESKFVFVPRADSPGHDYLRVDNSSFEECERRCDAQNECNAFTYNQIHKVCFLKVWANPQLTFYALAITGVKLSPSVRPTGLPANGTSFIVIPQADSPGNDYSRIAHFSFEDCWSSCQADDGCNAFTFNHSRGGCFLKRAANQWTNFHAWATTGIKLSSLQPKEKTATTAPAQPPAIAQPQIATPEAGSGPMTPQTNNNSGLPPEEATHGDTITAEEIAAGIASHKTELAQETWWDEHMGGKTHEISGEVYDVEKGTLSGYWVDLDLGRNIHVRCGFGDEAETIVKSLRKGSRFTCKGKVANTWTSMLGVVFSMEAGT